MKSVETNHKNRIEMVGTRVKKPAEKKTPKQIEIPTIDVQILHLPIIGTSPLIIHCFSAKSRQEMADKQQGKAKAGKEKKNPQAEYESCFYGKTKNGYLFPASGFKKCAVSACSSLKGVLNKTLARQSFHVMGDVDNFVEIIGKARMVEDTVRIPSSGAADLRYRPYIDEWRATLRIKFNALVITAEQLVNLFRLAGFAVGMGDWRSEKNGSNGAFTVDLKSGKGLKIEKTPE